MKKHSSPPPPSSSKTKRLKSRDGPQSSSSMPDIADYSEASPDTLMTMCRNGGTLIMLDLPEGTEFGMDYMTWQVGSKFRGVKMIPPGTHFIHYTAVSSASGGGGLRTSWFQHFSPGRVVFKRWDRRAEDLVPGEDGVGGEDRERIRANWEEMERCLGPYPIDKYRDWLALTSYISPGLVARLQPTGVKICSATPLLATGKVGSDGLPEMLPVDGSSIRLTEIPERNHPEGATPAEITQHNLDHSYKLANLLQQHGGEDTDVIGELQFAFVCFLLGHVLEAFEGWKLLVHLLCSCRQALLTHPHLYHALVNVLHFQIREIPDDFFVDIVSGNNFLVATLRDFFESVRECPTRTDSTGDDYERLKAKCARFEQYLTNKFEWDFSAEPEEYLPTVVD